MNILIINAHPDKESFCNTLAFSYKPNSLMWEKKLKGRTATIISTMNTPYWYYRWIYKRPAHYSIKKGLFEYCGIQPTKLISFSPIKNSSPKLREKWIKSVFKMGEKLH